MRALQVAFCRHQFSELIDNSRDNEFGHTVLVGCHCERCNIVLAASKHVCRLDPPFPSDERDFAMRIALAVRYCYSSVVDERVRLSFQWWRFL